MKISALSGGQKDAVWEGQPALPLRMWTPGCMTMDGHSGGGLQRTVCNVASLLMCPQLYRPWLETKCLSSASVGIEANVRPAGTLAKDAIAMAERMLLSVTNTDTHTISSNTVS